MNREEKIEMLRFYQELRHQAESTLADRVIQKDVLDLAELEHALHHYAEIYCNREMTDREVKREESLQKKAAEIMQKYRPAKVEFNGDPRGACIKIFWRDKAVYNSFDGESFRIYF